ncbi:exosortase F system-associated protein [Flavobacterium sp. JLP]|uniref:exosortase F system-associated membrane protein n=1 Tax=unclassified Flavobacterium TaxID=196869 RepID=UPI000493622E|nr:MULTISPECIES: exosortase F system-associated protein [unclassified Flavobacterium]MBF4494047.1 exosortase F system-associated protein [Flavobacterium sp. MR2016-29]MBF4506683.1 exosortase F system-associated protein [Flavobacterium sp. JLP]
MLNKLIEHKFKILIAISIVICFGLIRAFEIQLFYDPFLDYFENDYKTLPYPEVNMFKLFCGLFLRYFLNTILSLLLIYILFKDVEIFKFSVFLYLFFFVLLFGMFFIVLNYLPNDNWLLFYVRRFIIQPIFALLFIPAFYYQQQNFKK